MITAAPAAPRRTRAALLALTLALGLASVPSLALAQDADEAAPETPSAQLDQAVRNVLSAIELFLLAIPQYAAPEVLPNGDIVIRRIPRDGEDGGASPGAEGEDQQKI